ncbi:hypothetical protein [Paraburkholderia lacunae]|uniref:Secretion system X translation initiation factor n=1 Tax=Paraburkholderia lacunae TaxID=2211104 RepID=A0A370MWI2_9BURK|nr:hypothetical protein [Paraburkholderia lacunae]RDJ97738.1 hypothetical protein DLM46_36455 [Paraburkholderia lacunae]
MKPDLVRRLLITFCGIVAAGLSFRELAPAMQTPAVVAAASGAHHDDARARTVALHREGAAQVPDSAAHGANPASAADAAHVVKAASAAQPAGPAKAAKAAPTPRERLIALRAPLSLTSANNPFVVSSWLPPPPPPVAAPVPEPVAPPTAPPVPFTYLGELDAKAAKPQVFLSSGDRLLIVSPGEVVDEQYRVESISENEVVLTYLPLNERQVLSTQAKENK